MDVVHHYLSLVVMEVEMVEVVHDLLDFDYGGDEGEKDHVHLHYGIIYSSHPCCLHLHHPD